jgi:competence protein ComEA
MVIIIYTKDEVNNFNKIKEKEIIEDKKCQNNEIIVNDACKENNNSNNNNNNNEGNETKKVNINTATLEELMSLTGIGEGKAKDIISYRDSHGLFSKIEDLMNVSGIGESTFAKIKENITV